MANKINYKLILIILTLCLGVFLRFYKITEIPPGLIQDEAAFGYNAYSVLMTGRDEYGKVLPLAFRSFADYKLPLYTYLSVVPIKLFGLNIFSLRFASAFAGSISSLFVFFIVRELFGSKRFGVAFFCMLVFATAPWSIFFSRGAHEANFALLLFLLGFLNQLVAFRRKRYGLFFLSAILFALTTYTYIAFKFLSLLFFVSTFIFFKKINKHTILALLLFVALATPQYYLMRYAAGSNRITSLLDTQRIFPRYVSYFSPRSVFFDPDPDGNKSYPDLSTFYPWMFAPYLLGLFIIFRSKNSPFKLVFLSAYLLAPFPASVAKDPFSNIRALPFVFPLSIIIGIGIEKLYSSLPKKFSLPALSLLIIFSGLFLYRNNFVLLPSQRYKDWVFGFRQISEIIKREYPNKKILLNDVRGVYYAELLFFMQYPPSDYLKENASTPYPNYYDDIVFNPVHHFGNFETRPVDWGPDSDKDQIIISDPIGINPLQAKEHRFERVFSISGADGLLMYTGYQTKPTSTSQVE